MKKLLTVLVCLLIAAGTSAFAQKEKEVKTGAKMSGYIFGDYFFKMDGDPTISATSSQFSGEKKNAQAFNIRRAYLYFDYTFNEQFAGRILIENNDKQFNSDSRFSFFLKQAYLEWKEVYPGAKLLVGIIPTSEWAGGLAEKGWTYRSVEKTVLDKSGLGTGADLGVGVWGKFDPDGMFNYSFAIGNGTGTKAEVDKYKKYYVSLNAQPLKGLFAEVHFDFQPSDNDLNKQTIKGLLYYQNSDFTIGFEALQRTENKTIEPEVNVIPFGMSGYAIYKIADNFKCFARFDNYNPNTEITNAGYTENFITAGIDFMPIPDVHIMPNIWMTTFAAKADVVNPVEKATDIVPRITFFVNFK